jgi:hypothetical protein
VTKAEARAALWEMSRLTMFDEEYANSCIDRFERAVAEESGGTETRVLLQRIDSACGGLAPDSSDGEIAEAIISKIADLRAQLEAARAAIQRGADIETVRILRGERKDGAHDENCDTLQLSPSLGPSTKPCNCWGCSCKGDGQVKLGQVKLKPSPRPVKRWTVYKPDGYAKAVCFDGATVLILHEGAVANRAEGIVKLLNQLGAKLPTRAPKKRAKGVRK